VILICSSIRRVAAFAAALVLILIVMTGAPRIARADGAFDGKWSMSPMGASYTVREWVVSACGPAPVPGAEGGGGPVTIHQEGDELVIVGGRVFRTNMCWDMFQMPTEQRVAHSASASGRGWTTRCATPPGDPRRATITTNISATSDTQLLISETGTYELTMQSGTCIADVRRSSTLNLIARAGVAASASASASAAPPPPPPPTAAAPPPPPPPSLDCSAPGDPARLEVRPSRKLVRTGESFTFRATTYDARGCPTPTTTTWKAEAAAVTIDGSGTLSVPADAAEGEYPIDVSAAGKTTTVVAVVTSPAKYEGLLAQGALDANGEVKDPSVALIATGSIGSTTVRAEDASGTRKMIFVGVLGALVVGVCVLAWVGKQRSKRADEIARAADERHADRLRDYEERKRAKEAQHAAQMRAHLDSVQRAQEQAAATGAAEKLLLGAMVCPSCRHEYPAGSVYCATDSNRLIPLTGHEDVLTGPAGGICPTCKRGFNPGVKVCPDHGEELVPYSMHAAMAPVVAPAAAQSRGKICPTCGDRFDGAASFCGKDGTSLVLLN
jgi:hypothetical protein